MCLTPIHIKRSYSSYLGRLSKSSDLHVFDNKPNFVAYDVPCGKCPQCLNQRKSDYFLRCSYEWEKSNQHALFLTLTYDNFHLPLIESVSGTLTWVFDPINPKYPEILETPSYKLISVWYKPHVQKFLKQLNEKLIYYIGTKLKKLQRLEIINGRRRLTEEWKNFLSTQVRPIKYLFVCERGSADIYLDDKGHTRQGTSRPHYHGIIFINDPILYNHINYILNLAKSLWIYGNSYNIQIQSNSLQPLRNSIQCIEYVCKYITKDISDISNNLLYYDHSHALDSKQFVLLSKGLGSGLLDTSNISNALTDGITIPNSKGTLRSVNPPLYNIRKLTKHYISGHVSSHSIVKKVDIGPFYDPVNSQPFFLTTDDVTSILSTLPSSPIIHTKVITNKLGQSIDINNRIRKAEYYAYNLSLFQQSFNLSYLWQQSETPLSNRNYHDDLALLHSVSPDDLYLFILNDLYINVDQSDHPNTLYMVYDLVRNIISTEKFRIHRKREIEYKLNLSKSVDKKPQLFNIKPL